MYNIFEPSDWKRGKSDSELWNLTKLALVSAVIGAGVGICIFHYFLGGF